MTTATDSEAIRRSSLKYLWMHNRDWTQMAEEGEPLVIVEGNGVRVTDSAGKSWIDVNGGYNSVNAGYGRTEITEAAYEQMLKLPYFPNQTTSPPTIKLARKLAEITPGSLSRAFLSSGGSEANETAIKIARSYHRRRGETGRYKIISRKGSYHGATAGVLWTGGETGADRRDFEPAYPGMVYAPQPNPYRCERGGETPSECAVRCAKAVADLIMFHGPSTVAAVIAEPVSVRQGAVVPGDEYWPMLREICDEYGVLLIVDEVITGFGRTGKMFAIEHWNVVPDIMTVAKGIISSYLPLAATVATKEVADVFGGKDNTFRHIFTFSGHPVSAAAALRNIEIIQSEGLVQNAAEIGAYLKERLEGLKADHPLIGDVRGIGLLTAVELVADPQSKAKFPTGFRIADRLNAAFKKHGLIFRVGDEILNIGPPLCITHGEIDEIVNALNLTLREIQGQVDDARTT